jgi:LuxR family maltose regulon positive regulatory protein
VPDEERRSLRADIAVTRSNVHAMRGDAAAVIPQIDAVRAELDPDRPVMQSLAAMSTGFALLYRGEAVQAAEAFHDAWEISRDESNGYAMLLAAMGESYACRAAGAVERAEATCRSAIRWSEERSHPSPIVGTLYANLADLLLERNELDAALQEAEEAISIAATPTAREGRWLEWRLFSDLALARVQHARGDTAGARAVLRETRLRLEGVYVAPLTVLFDAVEAQMDLAEGKVTSAQERLTAGNQRQPLHLGLSPQYYVYAYEHLAVAPIQIGMARARERADETDLGTVATALADMEMRAERDRIPWLKAKTGALSALLTAQRGDEEAALGTLSRAVEDAAGRYVRLFLDEGMPMLSLLRALHERDAGRGPVAGLLEAWQTAAR